MDRRPPAAVGGALLVLGALLLAPLASAEPLSADRPGVTNPPDVVGPRVFQFEGGISFARETHGGDPNVNTFTLPQGLLRLGILRPLEVRVFADGLIAEERSGAGNRASGSDMVVGTRARLFDQEAIRPATALEFDLSLPTGSDAVTSDGVDPSGTFLVEWALGEHFALDANLVLASVSRGVDHSGRAFQASPSFSLGAALGDSASLFVEYYATFSDRGVHGMNSFDGGFSYRVDDDLQLDVSAGAGLDDSAPDFTVSAGLAWRFFSVP